MTSVLPQRRYRRNLVQRLVVLNAAQRCTRGYKYGVRGHRAVMDRHSLPDADPDPWAISLNECGPRWRLSIFPPCLSGRDCLFGLGCNGSLHLAAWCWRTPPSSLFPLLCLPPPPSSFSSSSPTHHLILPPHHFSISVCFFYHFSRHLFHSLVLLFCLFPRTLSFSNPSLRVRPLSDSPK